MFRIPLGKTSRYCDGIVAPQLPAARRGRHGLGRPAGSCCRSRKRRRPRARPKKDTSVILLWLDGGPGHMDMYDMKPEAPAEYRGIWRPIQTNVPGIEITELFPLQAKIADKFSIVRSLHHDTGDHFTGGHWMLTGRGGRQRRRHRRQVSRSSARSPPRSLGPRQPGMPANVAVPYAMSIGLRPGYFGGNYLGPQHNPFETDGDPNTAKFQVQEPAALPKQLTLDRLDDRRSLLAHFDQLRRDVDRQRHARRDGPLRPAGLRAGHRRDGPQGVRPRRRKTPKLRDRYGRHTVGPEHAAGPAAGRGRRDVRHRATSAAGTITGTCKTGYENYLPQDRPARLGAVHRSGRARPARQGAGRAVRRVQPHAADERRRQRRPARLSMGTPGRDHWGNAMFCLLGGGGVKGGQIVGSTNRLGEAPKDRPVTPGDIHHTIFHVLGVDPHLHFLNHSGRPDPRHRPRRGD